MDIGSFDWDMSWLVQRYLKQQIQWSPTKSIHVEILEQIVSSIYVHVMHKSR